MPYHNQKLSKSQKEPISGKTKADQMRCTHIGLAEIEPFCSLLAAPCELFAEVNVRLDRTRLLGGGWLSLVRLGHLDGDHLGPVGVGSGQGA